MFFLRQECKIFKHFGSSKANPSSLSESGARKARHNRPRADAPASASAKGLPPPFTAASATSPSDFIRRFFAEYDAVIASLVARRSRGRPAGTGPEAAQVGVSGAGASGCGAGVELNEFVRIVRTPFDGMLASAAPRQQQQGAFGGAPDAESVSLTSGSLLEDGARDSPPGALLLEAGGGAGVSATTSTVSAISAEDAKTKTDLVLHPSGDLAECSSPAAAMARPESASATTSYDSNEKQQHTSAKPSAKKPGAPRSTSAHSRSSERSASPASSHATDEDGDTTASEPRSHSGNEGNEGNEDGTTSPKGTVTASPTSPTNNGLKSSAAQPALAPLVVKTHRSKCVEQLKVFHSHNKFTLYALHTYTDMYSIFMYASSYCLFTSYIYIFLV